MEHFLLTPPFRPVQVLSLILMVISVCHVNYLLILILVFLSVSHAKMIWSFWKNLKLVVISNGTQIMKLLITFVVDRSLLIRLLKHVQVQHLILMGKNVLHVRFHHTLVWIIYHVLYVRLDKVSVSNRVNA